MFAKIITFVKSGFNRCKKGLMAAAGAVGIGAVTAGPSHAVAILDLTAVSTAVTTELTPAIAAAMPIAGTLLAVGIGWKLYKRFTK